MEVRLTPEIQPDASRVIRRLSEQLAEALTECAMLRDVVEQYATAQARATNPAPTEGSGGA